MPTTRQWEIQNSMLRRQHTVFSRFLRAQNMVRVIEGKIIWKWSEGKQKLLQVSGSFELSRVQVSEGKITVNVWWKSRGNRFWFELAQGSSYPESTVFAAPCTSSVPSTLTSPFLALISPPCQWSDSPNLQIIICNTLQVIDMHFLLLTMRYNNKILH